MEEEDDELELENREAMLRWNFRIEMEIEMLTTLLPNSVGPATHPAIPAAQREITNDHRSMMQSIANNGVGVQEDMRQEGLLERNPDLGERLQDAASKLAINVDLYTWFVRIREAHADYSRRHEDIMNFINHVMPDELFEFWPALYAAFLVYRQVAPARLAAAAPRSDA